MRRVGLVILAVVLVLMIVCGTLTLVQLRRPHIRHVPQPEVPAEIASLPRDAWVTCRDHSPGSYNLWELPGVRPSDPNSAFMGARGADVGEVMPCTQVSILQRSWSTVDGYWWVLVKQDDQEGWLALQHLQIEAPVPSP